MMIKEVGVVNRPSHFDLDLSRNNFLLDWDEMIRWYYSDDNTIDIYYEDIDDRTTIIYLSELHNETITSRSFTIGSHEKSLIKHKYLFYHPRHKGIKT